MAMLAGPRRKQKVINLRAKNNAWSNDSNKFGQRMLEKMGWSSGKGLGANESGIVEHVIAKYKNDEKGLGFQDRNDQWTKHEDDFNALLSNLSNGDGNEEKLHSGVSLEVKSKKSKARVHYHKFTRGKDLTRYSEKDLANIFGKKSLKVEEQIEKPSKEVVITTETIFTEKGSMETYFKDKLALKMKNRSSIIGSEDNHNVSEDNIDCGFQGFSGTANEDQSENNFIGFGYQFFKQEHQEIDNSQLLHEYKENPKMIKKKRKHDDFSNNECVDNSNNNNGDQEVNIMKSEESSKKKKNKLNCQDSSMNTEILDEDIVEDIDESILKGVSIDTMLIHEQSEMQKEVLKKPHFEHKNYVIVQNHVKELVGDELKMCEETLDTSTSCKQHEHIVQTESQKKINYKHSKVHSSRSTEKPEDTSIKCTKICSNDLEELRTLYNQCKMVLTKIESKYGHLLNIDNDNKGESIDRTRRKRNNSYEMDKCECFAKKKILFDDDGKQVVIDSVIDNHICSKKLINMPNYSKNDSHVENIQIENDEPLNLSDDLLTLRNILQDPDIETTYRNKVIGKMKAIKLEHSNEMKFNKHLIKEKLKLNPDENLNFNGTNLSTLPGYLEPTP